MSATDDDWLVMERRIVALFDACVKSVAIDVSDGEAFQFRVRDDAGRPTGWATGMTPFV